MSLWMKSHGVTIQMKATEQYFPVVLFITLYKVVLTFESVDEISHLNYLYFPNLCLRNWSCVIGLFLCL